MKKVIALSAAAALLVAVVAPVLALELNDSSLLIRSNVRSRVRATSNTGNNVAMNGTLLYQAEADDTTQVTDNTIATGVADAAAFNTTSVNTVDGAAVLGTESEMDELEFTSRARVRTYTRADANSGNNIAINAFIGVDGEVDDLSNTATNSITTGDAISTADSLTVVNSSYSETAL